jgi:hypothetical protein
MRKEAVVTWFKEMSRLLLVRIAEVHANLSIVGVSAEIWSSYFQNTSQIHYGLSQLA